MNKFELVRKILLESKLNNSNLIDIGCRHCELKSYVSDLVLYEGLDIFQNNENSVDYVINIENGLPFNDNSYDFVIALDVLEHLDDMKSGVEELLRITNAYLIIMLPNIAHILFRLRFLLYGKMGGKYDINYNMGYDRHRWITVLDQCDEYLRKFSVEKNLEFKKIWHNDSKKKVLLEKFGRLINLPASLWVWSSLYVLKKR